MKCIGTHHRFVRAATIAAVLAVALYPASSMAGSDPYAFEVVGHPTATTVTVELVDRASGSPVANAELFRLKWVYGGAKNQPSRRVAMPLAANGDGSFTAEADPGDTLWLEARVPGNEEPIRGSVEVGP